jgi:hypothetical protein
MTVGMSWSSAEHRAQSVDVDKSLKRVKIPTLAKTRANCANILLVGLHVQRLGWVGHSASGPLGGANRE